MIMENWMIGILVMAVAMVTSMTVFPWALKFARKHGIVDNPNARKLQCVPVPVFGGIVVYSGILMGGLVLAAFMWSWVTVNGLIWMTIMLLIGMWDDQKDVSAMLRFAIEIGLVSAFIVLTGVYIDDLHGLWGINELNDWIAIPFSVFAGVGIINAVNMIDGVDGYASGFCILACLCFATLFWLVEESVMLCMALVVAASLLPFFFHNVFGVKSKMYIGDGGTMMLGVLMVVFVFFMLSANSKCGLLENNNVGLLAFSLSVMCIPIFDTLRVMTLRIIRGYSPFKSDRTHLHHLFIEMGFSHLGAAMSILLINMSIVLIWFVAWKTGLSIETQTYIVAILGLAVTFGFYKLMKIQQFGGRLDENGEPQGTVLWHFFCELGDKSQVEKGSIWRFIQKLVDDYLMW